MTNNSHPADRKSLTPEDTLRRQLLYFQQRHSSLVMSLVGTANMKTVPERIAALLRAPPAVVTVTDATTKRVRPCPSPAGVNRGAVALRLSEMNEANWREKMSKETIFFNNCGPMIQFEPVNGVLYVTDLNPEVTTHWAMTPREMIVMGLRAIWSGLRSLRYLKWGTRP